MSEAGCVAGSGCRSGRRASGQSAEDLERGDVEVFEDVEELLAWLEDEDEW